MTDEPGSRTAPKTRPNKASVEQARTLAAIDPSVTSDEIARLVAILKAGDERADDIPLTQAAQDASRELNATLARMLSNPAPA